MAVPMDPEQLHDELAFVNRMIAESKLHIAELKATIAEMSRDGQDSELARDVLAIFMPALARYEAQRRDIVTMMQRKAS